MTKEEESSEVGRGKGRPPRKVPAQKYAVSLPPAVAEWAKSEPEGLSGLTEKLLTEEMTRRKKMKTAIK